MDPRRSQVVELKYFGGLNNDEIAEVLKISEEYRNSRLEHGARVASSPTHRERGELNPERWQQVSRIFKSAISLDEAARARYVKEKCGTDSSLREEVERLISSHEQAEMKISWAVRPWTTLPNISAVQKKRVRCTMASSSAPI